MVSEVVAEPGRQALVTAEAVPAVDLPARLFAGDASAIVKGATQVADALAAVIEHRRLFITIQGRSHVRVEGWALLGSMLGVFPVCVECRPSLNGWQARVEARTLSGALVGAAVAICTRDEPAWAHRPDYALASMAQTRATSKALRLPLGFVVALAGYDTTPAEEMDGGPAGRAELKAARVRITLPHPAWRDAGDTDTTGRPLGWVGDVRCFAVRSGKGWYLQSTEHCAEHSSPWFLAAESAADGWAHGKGAEQCLRRDHDGRSGEVSPDDLDR